MNSVTIEKASVPVVIYGNRRVITTECLSSYFGAPAVRLRQNYQRNAERFVEGKHFFKLTGTALKDFVSISEIPSKSSKARAMMLWTDRGVARHAKMLETDAAWELFEKLEDAYFSHQVEIPAPERTAYAGNASYSYGREQLDSLSDWGRRALPPTVQTEFFAVTKELERALIRGWTEMDEAILHMAVSMAMLKRWKMAH